MKKILIILLLIVGCEETLEPQDCAGVAGGTAELDNCNVCDSDPINDCVQDCDDVWGGENNYCLQADYRYPLEIGNRWEYEIAYSGNEVIAGESAGDMTGNIIITIIDTVTLLDSINAYKFEHILIGFDYNSQIDTSYIYGNNNENGFVIYGQSGYGQNGLPRVEIELNGFSFNTIFDPFGSYSNIYNNDSDCNNSIYYYSPEWERILYPINSDEEWIWFDENTNYVEMCEDTDSTYVISQSNPFFSTVRSYGDTTTYTFDDQIYESFTINTEWQGIAGEISASTIYSNIGLMYKYFNLGEQVGMDEFGNPTDNWDNSTINRFPSTYS